MLKTLVFIVFLLNNLRTIASPPLAEPSIFLGTTKIQQVTATSTFNRSPFFAGFVTVIKNESQREIYTLKFSDYLPSLNVQLRREQWFVASSSNSSSTAWHGSASFVNLAPQEMFTCALPLSALLPSEFYHNESKLQCVVTPYCSIFAAPFLGTDLFLKPLRLPEVKGEVAIFQEDYLRIPSPPRMQNEETPALPEATFEKIGSLAQKNLQMDIFAYKWKKLLVGFEIAFSTSAEVPVLLSTSRLPVLKGLNGDATPISISAADVSSTGEKRKPTTIYTLMRPAAPVSVYVPLSAYAWQRLALSKGAKLTLMDCAYSWQDVAQGGLSETPSKFEPVKIDIALPSELRGQEYIDNAAPPPYRPTPRK